MSNDSDKSCPLYGERNGCRAVTSDQELCGRCRGTHPAVIRPWRDTHPQFDKFFKWTDEHNEKPKTCVVRRKRYAYDKDCEMVAAVLESWKNRAQGKRVYHDDASISYCEPTNKDDTVCRWCKGYMSDDVRGKYFMDDGTVEEEYRKPAEDAATLSQESS